MALIGKARLQRGLGRGQALTHHPARPIELAHGAKAGGARAERGPELARQRPAIEARQRLQLARGRTLAGLLGDPVPRTPQRRQRERSLPSRRHARSGLEQVGDACDDLGSRHLVDRLVEVGQDGPERVQGSAVADDRVGDEGQGMAAEGLLDERRIDVEDPVAKAGLGAGGAVVGLVRVKHVALAGQADPSSTAIAEALGAGERDADGVGVVAVRREGTALETRLQPLDALAAQAGPDGGARPRPSEVAGLLAQAFKTPAGSVAYRRCHRHETSGTPVVEQLPSLAGMARPLLALMLTSLVVMGSPGPATISVAGVGAAFGFRRTLPYMLGLILGTCAVLVAVAAGAVSILASFPGLAPVLAVVSALYMLYLAFKIATAPPLESKSPQASAPPLAAGLLLGIANPKAYVAITAVFTGTIVAAGAPLLDGLAKLVALSGMIVLIHLCWLVAGSSFSRFLHDPLRSRIVNIALAVLLLVSVTLALLR